MRALAPLLAIVLLGASCASLTPPQRAAQLARQHREEEGVALLRDQLKKHPDDIDSRRMLVRLLAVTSDLAGAKAEVAELEKRLKTGDPLPWIELGHAYELVHRFDEALAAYDTAASTAPASPAGPREGGMRAARWGEVEEAQPRLEEAISRGARDGAVFHALGLVRLHQRDFTGAEAAYKEGLAVEPDGTENLLGLATVAVVKGDAEAALAAYGRLLQKNPRYAPAELGRAWALAKLGRREEAARAIDRAESLGASRANVDKQRAALRQAGESAETH